MILRFGFAAINLLAFAFVYFGLILHSQANGWIFGRYSTNHSILLVLMTGIGFLFFKFTRFLSTDSVLKVGQSGESPTPDDSPDSGEAVEVDAEAQAPDSAEQTGEGPQESGTAPTTRVWRAERKIKLYCIVVLLILACVEGRYVLREIQRKPKTIAKFHPFLQLQERRNRASKQINNFGFRGSDISIEKPHGTLRIFVIGGSTVYCGETRDIAKTHVKRLEVALKQKYPGQKFEVMNCGMEWYTTQHSIINYLFKLRDFKPDVVIFFHGINDLCRSFSPPEFAFGEYRSDYSHFHGPVAKYVQGRTRSRLDFPHPFFVAALLDNFLYSDLFAPEVTDFKEFKSKASFERNLMTFANNLRADGVQFIMATQGSIYRKDLDDEAKSKLWMNRTLCVADGKAASLESLRLGMDQFNKATRRVAKKVRAPLVDLDSQLPRTLEYFRDDVHYTDKGNEKIAELFLAELERLGWIR